MMDTLSLVATGLGGLTPLGGGIAFVWSKVEGRIKALEARQETTDKRLEQCQERDRASRTIVTKLIFATEMLMSEINPTSAVFQRVGRILREAHLLEAGFPPDPAAEDEMG